MEQRTIKAVMTNRFALSLIEVPKNAYRVHLVSDEVWLSEVMEDLGTAMFMFDLKLEDLELN